MNVLYSEGVFEELVEISYRFALIDEGIAQRFLDSCDQTFNLLAENRFVGYVRTTRKKELTGIRFFPVGKFPRFLIAYLPLEDGIRILHVFHDATDFRNRLELG